MIPRHPASAGSRSRSPLHARRALSQAPGALPGPDRDPAPRSRSAARGSTLTSAPRGLELGDGPLGCRLVEDVLDVVEHGAVFRLALPERLLGSLSLGNVDQYSHDAGHGAAIATERRCREGDVDRGAVLPLATQLYPVRVFPFPTTSCNSAGGTPLPSLRERADRAGRLHPARSSRRRARPPGSRAGLPLDIERDDGDGRGLDQHPQHPRRFGQRLPSRVASVTSVRNSDDARDLMVLTEERRVVGLVDKTGDLRDDTRERVAFQGSLDARDDLGGCRGTGRRRSGPPPRPA